MKQAHVGMLVLLILSASLSGQAQQTVATNTNLAVPPLVNFSGTLTDSNGKPFSGSVTVTFSLYSEQTGGAALWMESQSVQPDPHGHYTVTLGSTSSTGLPAEIFVAGQAHWLGVQVEGEAYENPRVLLLSVPYALKAGDAQTLGGLPASAFVLAAPPTSSASTATPESTTAATNASVTPATTSDVTTSGGTINAVPLFSTATNIQNSLLTQTGTSAINVGGKLNLPALGAGTSTAGFNSRPQDFVASAFSSSTSTSVSQTFQWQAEPSGNNTASPSGTLNLLYGLGATAPHETGLKVSTNGVITFAAGQTFPGTGTITGVTAGTGLTGGGTSGSVTVNLDTTKVPLLGAANAFTGNQAVNGSITATSSTAIGIVGNSSSTNGYGVEGVDKNNIGILGQGGIIGVQGSTPGPGYGVAGYAKGGFGVYGVDSATSGSSVGVLGLSTSSTGYGVEGSSSNVGVYGKAASTTGYGVEGTSSNVGVYGAGNYGVDGHGTLAGLKGVATASGGFSGVFQGGPVNVAGNNDAVLIGDPGCGSGYAGLGLTNNLSNCNNYTLIADTKGDTYLNSTGSAGIHFRNNDKGSDSDGDLATIDHSGNLTVSGTVHSGNAIASVSASNTVQASTHDCVLPLTKPNSNCLTPNMTVTVTTSGGPVFIMASIGGVSVGLFGLFSNSPCATPNFYLVMDDQILSSQQIYSANASSFDVTSVSLTALPTPAAGKHTFQVQEADDASLCGTGDYNPTGVSYSEDPPAWPNPPRTLIVREF